MTPAKSQVTTDRYIGFELPSKTQMLSVLSGNQLSGSHSRGTSRYRNDQRQKSDQGNRFEPSTAAVQN